MVSLLDAVIPIIIPFVLGQKMEKKFGIQLQQNILKITWINIYLNFQL